MKLHYLEIVSPKAEDICAEYETIHKLQFSEPDPMLGGAKTALLADGSTIAVRKPLRDTETPVVRPYWLVDDIEKAVKTVQAQGAEIAVEPLEIAGKGTFAIYIQGGIENGFWQK